MLSRLKRTSKAARLFLVNLDDVILLHLEGFRGFVIVDAPPVKEEPEAGHWDANPLAVAFLQLAHLGGLLHAEVDLVGVLAYHLQLDVLSLVGHVGISFDSLLRSVIKLESL